MIMDQSRYSDKIMALEYHGIRKLFRYLLFKDLKRKLRYPWRTYLLDKRLNQLSIFSSMIIMQKYNNCLISPYPYCFILASKTLYFDSPLSVREVQSRKLIIWLLIVVGLFSYPASQLHPFFMNIPTGNFCLFQVQGRVGSGDLPWSLLLDAVKRGTIGDTMRSQKYKMYGKNSIHLDAR